jgi:hypothetical protein
MNMEWYNKNPYVVNICHMLAKKRLEKNWKIRSKFSFELVL